MHFFGKINIFIPNINEIYIVNILKIHLIKDDDSTNDDLHFSNLESHVII